MDLPIAQVRDQLGDLLNARTLESGCEAGYASDFGSSQVQLSQGSVLQTKGGQVIDSLCLGAQTCAGTGPVPPTASQLRSFRTAWQSTGYIVLTLFGDNGIINPFFYPNNTIVLSYDAFSPLHHPYRTLSPPP